MKTLYYIKPFSLQAHYQFDTKQNPCRAVIKTTIKNLLMKTQAVTLTFVHGKSCSDQVHLFIGKHFFCVCVALEDIFFLAMGFSENAELEFHFAISI